ncbi:MAG: hypothetical protein KJ709_02985 [Nanoarchaeota archaeon]|nr:hypothetical protein [Nanoarchaeota archaeon]
MPKESELSYFVAIPAVVCGVFMVVALFFLIFAKDSLPYLTSIVWAFAVFGIFAEFFVLLASKKKK